MKMNKYWWLGFLGFVGFYKFPEVWAYFDEGGSPWVMTGLLWFLWFLEFIPTKRNKTEQ
jgi:hypothetical protein